MSQFENLLICEEIMDTSSADTCREMWNVLAFASTARHVSAAKRKAANGRTLNSPLSWQFG